MKQLLLPAAVILMLSTKAFANPIKHSPGNSVTVSDVSKISAALSLVPTSKVTVAPKEMIDETNGDEDEGYDIHMSGKDFKGEVLYDNDGSLIGYYEQIKNTQMPFAVMNAIETKYPGARFTKDAEDIDDNNGTVNYDEYKVNFIYGKKRGYAVVKPDGTIIRSRK